MFDFVDTYKGTTRMSDSENKKSWKLWTTLKVVKKRMLKRTVIDILIYVDVIEFIRFGW